MKKGTIAAAALAVIVVVCLTLWGRQYYNDRYVGADYYAVVPADYGMTPRMFYTSDGEEMGLGVEYRLTAYNGEGEAKNVEFTIMDKDSGWATAGEYLKPGTYLKISASKRLVVGWAVTTEEQIPAAALERIKDR